MIEISDLIIHFDNRDILKNINLTILDGDFAVILGPSGSGKTTLLNCIGALEPYYNGSIKVDNKELKEMNSREIDIFHNKIVSFIFQQFLLDENLTVEENVRIPLIYEKRPESKKKIISALEKVSLLDMKDKKAKVLSGGEKQRVAIARAIVMDTKIILADEVTGQLDTKNAQKIIDLLVKLNHQGKTIIFVTHNSNYCQYASRIFNIQDGFVSENNI